MKKTILLFILIYGLKLFSQQNFINVPSSEVTSPKKLFFQQQLNFSQLIQSNTTLDYGLGKGFEVGINVFGLNYNAINNRIIQNDTINSRPYNPLMMVNGLKHFKLSENIAIAVGGQGGVKYPMRKNPTQAYLAYTNLRMENLIVKHSHLVLGAYVNSQHYGGNGNRFGGWIGFEIPAHSKLH